MRVVKCHFNKRDLLKIILFLMKVILILLLYLRVLKYTVQQLLFFCLFFCCYCFMYLLLLRSPQFFNRYFYPVGACNESGLSDGRRVHILYMCVPNNFNKLAIFSNFL